MTPRDALARATTGVLCRLGEVSHRTFVLPIVVFSATSRCNSRCVSCSWWRHTGATDLSAAEVDAFAAALPRFGTKLVAFSGGEPLTRPDVCELARSFRARGLRLELLTSGLGLERRADALGRLFARVTVSVDAADRGAYRAIRGVDGFQAVETGVAALRAHAPQVRILARCTVHRLNFRDLPRIVDYAASLGVDGLSFVAADLSSTAFGRSDGPRPDALRLNVAEVAEFAQGIDHLLTSHRWAFEDRFVTDPREKLQSLPRYFGALIGLGPFPSVRCNAPWVSVVVEGDGTVRPCFFHQPIGNLRDEPFEHIVRERLPAFRRGLHVGRDATCERCVCTLRVHPMRLPS